MLRWVILGIAALALALQGADAAFGFGGWAPADSNDLLISISMCAAALAALLAAAASRTNRLARLAISVGVALYAVGETYYLTVQKTLTGFPTTSDFLWLSLYPLILIGVFLVIRSETPGKHLRVMLDGAIVALATVALGYELLLKGIVHDAATSATVVGGQLGYPLLDLAVLTMLLVFGLGNRRALHLS